MGTDEPEMKRLSSAANGLLSKRASSSLKQALDDRMMVSEAIEAATRIIRCYPNGGANAGDSYIGALAHMLASYPRSVAQGCADPLHGITRECRFLPSVADIVAWCERHTEPLRGHRDRELRIADQLAARAEYQRIEREDRPKRLTVAELKVKYGDWNAPAEADRRAANAFAVRDVAASELSVSPYLAAILRQGEAAQ